MSLSLEIGNLANMQTNLFVVRDTLLAFEKKIHSRPNADVSRYSWHLVRSSSFRHMTFVLQDIETFYRC